MNRRNIIFGSLVALAVFSTAACSATPDLQEQMDPAPQSSTAAQTPKSSTDTAPGGAEVGAKPAGSQSDEATQVHMEFTNNTGQVLKLVSASRGGDSAHWEKQAPATLGVGEEGFASSYSASNAQINLTYQGVDDNVTFTLFGETPLAGSNKASGSATSSSYTVDASAGSGYNPTDSYSIEPGGTLAYTGKDQQFTVPAGVTQLAIEATGGGADHQGGLDNGTAGAVVTGTLAVTPGQILTIGVGGQGGGAKGDDRSFAGGWGPTINGSNYRGGNSTEAGDGSDGIPGGGATVIADAATGTVLAVAGGAGGDGDVATECDILRPGGFGGAGGSWTGGNGDPNPGGGGQAGANTSTQGQDSTAGDDCAGGAGGGGVQGGMAGADGGGAGGGAGSSAAPGLTGTSVKAGSTNNGNQKDGWVTIGAKTS